MTNTELSNTVYAGYTLFSTNMIDLKMNKN